MNPIETLKRLKALREAATPGEWHSTWDTADLRRSDEQAALDDVPIVATESGEPVVGLMFYDGWWPSCTREDAALIAAAGNTDFTALLEYVERLERENAAIKESIVMLEETQ